MTVLTTDFVNVILTAISSSPKVPGWHGNLNLEFVNSCGQTRQEIRQLQAPLKVLRPFYPEGDAVCHSVLLHTAGGVVGGDCLSIHANLQPATRALITTAAATKLYRTNGNPASQRIDLKLGAGAILEWLPQPTIVFNGAVFCQDLQVELTPGAIWLSWEITRFGRTALGERFARGQWRSCTQISQQGRPLWIDRIELLGGSSLLDSPHGLAGQSVVGTLTWVGQPVTPEIIDRARSMFPQQLSASLSQVFGVTRLPDGLLCRYRGSSTIEVRQWFARVWDLLRLSYLGQPACKPRVWLV